MADDALSGRLSRHHEDERWNKDEIRMATQFGPAADLTATWTSLLGDSLLNILFETYSFKLRACNSLMKGGEAIRKTLRILPQSEPSAPSARWLLLGYTFLCGWYLIASVAQNCINNLRWSHVTCWGCVTHFKDEHLQSPRPHVVCPPTYVYILILLFRRFFGMFSL